MTHCSVKQVKHFKNKIKGTTEEKASPHLALLAHIQPAHGDPAPKLPHTWPATHQAHLLPSFAHLVAQHKRGLR